LGALGADYTFDFLLRKTE